MIKVRQQLSDRAIAAVAEVANGKL